jgi:hypothetical protein
MRRGTDLPHVGSRDAPDWEQFSLSRRFQGAAKPREEIVNGLIYLIGLIVVILFILSFFGLR